MLAPELLIPLVLAALITYTLDSARMIKELKNNAGPAARAAFFAGKLKRQFLAVLLLPALCLFFSSTFPRAWHPGIEARVLAARVSAIPGFSALNLTSLFTPTTAVEVILTVLLLEAIPLIRNSKSPIALGDFSILLPRSRNEFLSCAVLAVVAGVGEELLFRGFIPLGIEGFRVPYEVALSLSVLAFAACHLYQGPIGIFFTGVAGALLTAVYILTGSLLSVIAIHVAIDLIGLVIRPLTGLGLRRLLELISYSDGAHTGRKIFMGTQGDRRAGPLSESLREHDRG
jgi:membrane protease YdiL (CAAX protease family)